MTGATPIEVTNPATGQTWMDRNLGASRTANSSSDAQAFGHLYQWGRAADGHQERSSGTTSTLSDSDAPGHGNFILVPDGDYMSEDWRDPQNHDLWQGVNVINNPCPSGYRIPTKAELEAERQSWSSLDAAGAFGSPRDIKLQTLKVIEEAENVINGMAEFNFQEFRDAYYKEKSEAKRFSISSRNTSTLYIKRIRLSQLKVTRVCKTAYYELINQG